MAINAVKLGRNYRLFISANDGRTEPIEVDFPITVEFDIQRNYIKSANNCSIRVYNLDEVNRSLIRKNIVDNNVRRTVNLFAGYQNNLSLIFSGNISECWSVREGTNWISEMATYDGGFAFTNGLFDYNDVTVNGTKFVQGNFPATADQQAIIENMVGYLSNFGVQKGVIGKFPSSNVNPQTDQKALRGKSYSGSIIDTIDDLAKNCFFIDLGIANCLNINEALMGIVNTINIDNGLLNTPILQETILHVDMIFEPRIKVGQKITLQSTTFPGVSGDYKVMSVSHRGIISPAISGECVTSLQMFRGLADFEVLSG